jgi:hypothetical protein
MKLKYVLILGVSLVLNTILIREIVSYQPYIYKYRHYHKYKMLGWFDKGTPITKLKPDSTAYILVMGQANAGNTSNSLDTAGAGVYSYHKGKLYPAIDPMIGSIGYGGSVWPSIGDSLINDNKYKKVVFIPIAIGSTHVEDWATGDCSIMLKTTLDDMKARNIKLTHILWHQGESDNGTSKENYKKNLHKIISLIRDNQQSAPFYCSIASLSPLSKISSSGIDTNIQQAQIEFINENPGILAGPNTDLLNLAVDRYDGVHFSKAGKAKYMNQWLNCLRKNDELVR